MNLDEKSFAKVQKFTTWQKLKSQIAFIISYPFAHVFILGILLFIWMFRYTWYESLFILIWLAHTLMFRNSDFYFILWKFVYIPVYFGLYVFFYVINIRKLLNSNLYQPKNYKYGIFEFEYFYADLFFQMLTFFYSWLVCKLYSIYKQRIEDDSRKTLNAKRERLKSEDYKLPDNLQKDKEVKAYEILLANVLKYLDTALLTCLYITGTNRVDIFHIVLLIYLTLFIVYPKFMRRNFIYFVSSVILVVTFKYVYVLVAPEIIKFPVLYKVLFVLGLVNDFDENAKYWKSALINDNWLIVILAVIQYQLYKSKLLGWMFLETGRSDDTILDSRLQKNSSEYQQYYELNKRIMLFVKYPFLSRQYIYFNIIIAAIVPWLIYITFMILSMGMEKTLMNMQFTWFTIIFIIAHSLSKLVTSKSNGFIANIWSVYIVYSAISFLSILAYQVLEMDILENDVQFFVRIIPDFIKRIGHIIGFEDYSQLKTIQLALKLLPYVLNFSLGMYARRQMVSNSDKHKRISLQKDNLPYLDMTRPISETETFEEIVFGSRFNFAFLMFKLKRLWWLIDLIWHNFFFCVAVLIFMLSVYWQISIAMLINIMILSIYFFCISKNLAPNKIAENLNVEVHENKIELDDALQTRKYEKEMTNDALLKTRQKYTKILLVFNWFLYFLIYLSSFVEQFVLVYPSLQPSMDYVIFFANYTGIYYSQQTGIYSFWYQSIGYVAIIFCIAIERRMLVWLVDKQGLNEELIKYFETIEGNFEANRKRSINWFEEQYGVQLKKNSDKETKENSGESQESLLRRSEETKRMDSNIDSNEDSGSDKNENESSEKSNSDPSSNNSFDSFGGDSEFDIYNVEYETFVSKIDYEKETRIKEMLNIRYFYNFLRVIRVNICLWLILVTCIGIIFKGNLYSILSLIALVPLIFKKLSYSAIKQYCVFLIILSIFEYIVALSNLSAKNSPMNFPIPYNPSKEPYQDPPVPIPWFEKVGYFDDHPNWSYFLGCTETQRARGSIWYEWSWIMIWCIYFTVFNSIIIDKNYQIVVTDSILRVIFPENDEIPNQNKDKKLSRYLTTSENEESIVTQRRGTQDSGFFTDEKLVKRYIQNKSSKMTLRFVFQLMIDIFCSLSSIISLLSLLLMAFDSTGLINLFYVIFWLVFLYQMKNFALQKNWKFPYYLQKVLKPFVFFEIWIQILYQIPFTSMHKHEDHERSWQSIIGLLWLWTYEDNQIHSTEHINDMIVKSIMLVFIVMQDNIFNSIYYKEFIENKLSKLIGVSEIKAYCLAYIYNNK